MGEHPTFDKLIERVRAGDQLAAEELVRKYEPAIQRAVRVRLVNPSWRRVVDSMDICQSVMGSFFVRVALGQFDLESPEQLAGLLIRLAKNKVTDLARHEQAGKRDHRRLVQDGSAVNRAPAAQDSPSQAVAGAELLQMFRDKLSPEEKYLAEQRTQGREWKDLAAELGESPEALRKRHQRAVNRVALELGFEDLIDEA